jgi:hypothetical protein
LNQVFAFLNNHFDFSPAESVLSIAKSIISSPYKIFTYLYWENVDLNRESVDRAILLLRQMIHQKQLVTTSSALLLLLVLVDSWRVDAFATPRETVLAALRDSKIETKPLATTAQFVPPELISSDVIFSQIAVKEKLEGAEKFCLLNRRWDVDFQSDFGVKASIVRVSSPSQNLVRVSWNVTWVPPTALWLDGIGQVLKPTVETVYVSYNHLARQPSTFSWNAVFKLFQNVVINRKLSVPLACIEGSTELLFSDEPNQKVLRIKEELSYAEDLRRGVLQNRKCSQDLRLFLEVGRRLVDDPEEWDTKVARALPWESVAGSNPLDVDPVEEGPMAAMVFIGLAACSVILFASLAAPELIGQNLFGPPNYIVRPEDLNSLY